MAASQPRVYIAVYTATCSVLYLIDLPVHTAHGLMDHGKPSGGAGDCGGSSGESSKDMFSLQI